MRCLVPLVTVLATVQAGATGSGVFFVLGGQTRPHMAVSGPTHMVKTVHHVLLMDNGGHPMKAIVPDPDSRPTSAASTPQAVVVPAPLRRAGLSLSASTPPAVRMPHLYHYPMPRYGRIANFNFQPQFQQLPTYLSPTYTQPGAGANSYDMQGLKDLAARFLDPVDFKAISARQEMIDRHKAMLERQREMARQQEMLQRQIEAAEIQQDFDKMDQMLAQISGEQAPPSQPAPIETPQQPHPTEPHQPHAPSPEQPEQPQQPQEVHHHREGHHQELKQHEVTHEAAQAEGNHAEQPRGQDAPYDQQNHNNQRFAETAQHQEDHQTPIQAIAGHPQQVPQRFHRFHQQQQQQVPQQYPEQQYHRGTPQNFHQRQRRHNDQAAQVASSDPEAVWRNRVNQVVTRHVADGVHVIHDAPQHQRHGEAHSSQDEQPNESQKRVTIKEQVAASEVHETILKGKRRLTARLRLKERVPSSASAMFWI